MSLPLSHAGGSVDGISAALDLRFASSLSLTSTSGLTPSFSRASTGTFFNSSGVLTTAAINAPRFDYVYDGSAWVSKGLLVEEQRTNTSTYSEQFDNAAWTKAGGSISANQIAAPDGATTADKFTENSGSSVHYCLGSGGSIANNTICTASCFVKKGDRRYVYLTLNDGTATRLRYTVIFDLDTGTGVNEFSIGSPTDTGYFIQNFSNGWYKISVKIKTGSSQAYACEMAIGMSDSASPSTRDFTNPSYTGNGSSNFYLWGTQVEAGAFPTSYIPTTTAAVTRSADVCQITGGDFTSFWNATEGTFATEGDNLINIGVGSSREFAIVGAEKTSTSNESVTIWKRSAEGLSASVTVVGGAIPVSIYGSSAWADGATGRVAFGFKLNDYASSFNGSAVSTDTSGVMPSGLEELAIGYLRNSGGSIGTFFNGHISRLRYYAIRLPNRLLIAKST